MYLKLDSKLFKYFMLVALIYYMSSKISSDTLPKPLNNPIYFTLLFAIILYYFDNNNSNFIVKQTENFAPTTIENNNSNNILPTNKLMIKDFNTNIINDITNDSSDKIYTFEETKQVIENTPTNTDPNMMKNGLPVVDKIIADATNDVSKNGSCDCTKIANKAIVKFLQNRRLLDNNGMLHYADAYIGDMGYSDIKLDNYIPMGASGNGAYDTWELADFQLLNTDRWKPQQQTQRECKMGTLPQPQPLNKNTPLSLLNWDHSRTIAPPENINTNYLNDKFNKQQ